MQAEYSPSQIQLSDTQTLGGAFLGVEGDIYSKAAKPMKSNKYRSDRRPREAKPCATCGEMFVWKQRKTQKFCSNKCSQASRKTGDTKPCAECGTPVYRQPNQLKNVKGDERFCGKSCADAAHAKRLLKNDYKLADCHFCGEEFQTTYHKRKFCSVACSSRHNLKEINSKPPAATATKPEREMAALLDELGINYETQKQLQWEFGWKYFDFYLPDFNILLEVDGTYWHAKGLSINELNEQQAHTRQNDEIKTIIAAGQGYDLVRVWSDEINVTMLNKKLNKVTNDNK